MYAYMHRDSLESIAINVQMGYVVPTTFPAAQTRIHRICWEERLLNQGWVCRTRMRARIWWLVLTRRRSRLCGGKEICKDHLRDCGLTRSWLWFSYTSLCYVETSCLKHAEQRVYFSFTRCRVSECHVRIIGSVRGRKKFIHQPKSWLDYAMGRASALNIHSKRSARP